MAYRSRSSNSSLRRGRDRRPAAPSTRELPLPCSHGTLRGQAPVLLPSGASDILPRVRIELGPVSASSARSWIDNARRVLAGVRRAAGRLPITLPDDVGRAFEDYLDQWEDVTQRHDVFAWSA